MSVRNFTTSWRDGLAFSALLNKHRDDIAFPREHPREKEEMDKCLAKAFKEAEQKLGIQRLLDPEDVNVEYPDEKSIITYVVTLYHYFSKARDETVCSKRIRKVRISWNFEGLDELWNIYNFLTFFSVWLTKHDAGRFQIFFEWKGLVLHLSVYLGHESSNWHREADP